MHQAKEDVREAVRRRARTLPTICLFPTVALPRPHRVDQIINSKITLENQQLALESVNLNAQVMSAHKVGAQAMERAVQNMGGVEAVEELMDNVEEGFQARMANPNLNPNPSPDPSPDPGQAWTRRARRRCTRCASTTGASP